MSMLAAGCMLLLSGIAVTPDATADTIRTAYAANRAAFPHGTVRFRLTVGRAPTLEAARKGKLSPEWTAEGFYVFDGPRARYERIHTRSDMVSARTKRGPNEWNSPLTSRRFITDGRLTLWDVISVAPDDQSDTHTAQIDPGTEVAFDSDFLFPLDLGRPTPGRSELDRRIGDAGRPDSSTRLRDVREAKPGSSEVVVAFAWTGPPPGRCEYRVDLERGAIPIQFGNHAPEIAGKETPSRWIEYGDIRLVNGQGYLPFSMTIIDAPEGGSRYVQQLIITEAEFKAKPDTALFQLEFPEERRIINSASMVRYAAQKTWDLGKLPRSNSSDSQKITLSPAPVSAPVMPGPKPMGSSWPYIVVCGGLILLATAAILWRRSRA